MMLCVRLMSQREWEQDIRWMNVVPLVKKDNIVECVNDSGVTLIVNGVPVNELNVWIMKKLGFKTLIYMQRCNVLNVIQNRNYFFFSFVDKHVSH